MTYLETQVAGLSQYWWRGNAAANSGGQYSIEGMTVEQREAAEAGYTAGLEQLTAEHV